MAEETQGNQENEKDKITPSTGSVHKKGDKKVDGKSGSKTADEKRQAGLDLPQPLMVKEYKDGKQWLFKKSEIISMVALAVSIFAVILNKCSLDNTADSLEIADSAFQINRRSFEVANRAYVTFILAKSDTFKVDKKLKVVATIRNYGRNPVRINKTITTLDYGSYPVSKPMDTLKKNTRFWNVFLPTNGDINIPFDSVVINPEAMSQIRQRKIFLHLHGLVEYFDPALGKSFNYRYSVAIDSTSRFSPTEFNNILEEIY